MSRFLHTLFMAITLSVSCIGETIIISPHAALAQQSKEEAFDFNILAQPLASALDAYSSVTGETAVYDASLATGRRSSEVRGRFTASAALDLLLIGSGLVVQYSSAEAFVLVPEAPGDESTGTPSTIASAAMAQLDAAERGYSALIQASIGRALCATPETLPGGYRLAIRFDIDAAGQFAGVQLLGSTGNHQRDEAVYLALKGVSVGVPPPSYMQQPFTVVLLPRSSGGIVHCPVSADSAAGTGK